MEGQGKFELRLRINDADLHHTVFFLVGYDDDLEEESHKR
ncbi:unnamed protein product [Brassica rapa]|uniref:Uncharacterized protein n=2 Tax=Brassica TaxID=3705 RepID=A0A8D9CUJ3_BRACM|nr:unnamed protein product [Brassica napus]CAG7861627.1 unnamed protein product [Brassica rapa]